MTNSSQLTHLDQFEAASPAERLALASLVAEMVGHDFRPSKKLAGPKQMACVEHLPSKLQFVVVPGGRFSMGLTEADLARVRACTDFDAGSIQARIARFETSFVPVHEVVVAPFLLATSHATSSQLRTVTDDVFGNTAPTRDDAFSLMRILQGKALRLPSESELEYAGREGGSVTFVDEGDVLWKKKRRWPKESGWGLKMMTLASWSADEWHPNYEGAPSTSIPWRSDGPPGVYRGSLMYTPESEEELLFALAAVRGRLAFPDDEWDTHVRFACSLRG